MNEIETSDVYISVDYSFDSRTRERESGEKRKIRTRKKTTRRNAEKKREVLRRRFFSSSSSSSASSSCFFLVFHAFGLYPSMYTSRCCLLHHVVFVSVLENSILFSLSLKRAPRNLKENNRRRRWKMWRLILQVQIALCCFRLRSFVRSFVRSRISSSA